MSQGTQPAGGPPAGGLQNVSMVVPTDSCPRPAANSGGVWNLSLPAAPRLCAACPGGPRNAQSIAAFPLSLAPAVPLPSANKDSPTPTAKLTARFFILGPPFLSPLLPSRVRASRPTSILLLRGSLTSLGQFRDSNRPKQPVSRDPLQKARRLRLFRRNHVPVCEFSGPPRDVLIPLTIRLAGSSRPSPRSSRSRPGF